VQRNLLGILLAAALGVLPACHHSGGAALLKRHASVAAAASPTDQGPADLVAAVSLSGSGEGAVGLKFQLGQRPVAGQPVDIVLRLVVNQPLEHLEARFHTDDGLDIPQGSDFDPEGHMDPGSAVEHRLTVVAAHEGVYTVMATLTTGTAAEAVSHSFVIPIVFEPAGPTADAAAAKAP
jgi:hypothetical protein